MNLLLRRPALGILFALLLPATLSAQTRLCTLCDGLGIYHESYREWEYNVIQRRKGSFGQEQVLYDQKWYKKKMKTVTCPSCAGKGMIRQQKSTVVLPPDPPRSPSWESLMKKRYGGSYENMERFGSRGLWVMTSKSTGLQQLVQPDASGGRVILRGFRYIDDGRTVVTVTYNDHVEFLSYDFEVLDRLDHLNFREVGGYHYIWEKTRSVDYREKTYDLGHYRNVMTGKVLTSDEYMKYYFFGYASNRMEGKTAWLNDQLILAAKYDPDQTYGSIQRFGFLNGEGEVVIPFIFPDVHSVDVDAGVIHMMDRHRVIHRFTLDGKEVLSKEPTFTSCPDGRQIMQLNCQIPVKQSKKITSADYYFLLDEEGNELVGFPFDGVECGGGTDKFQPVSSDIAKTLGFLDQHYNLYHSVDRLEEDSYYKNLNAGHLNRHTKGGDATRYPPYHIYEKKGKIGLQIPWVRDIVKPRFARIAHYGVNSDYGALVERGKVNKSATLALPGGIRYKDSYVLEMNTKDGAACGYLDIDKGKTGYDKCSPELAIGIRLYVLDGKMGVIVDADHLTEPIFRQVDVANCSQHYATAQAPDGKWGVISLEKSSFGKIIVPFAHEAVYLVAEHAFITRNGGTEKSIILKGRLNEADIAPRNTLRQLTAGLSPPAFETVYAVVRKHNVLYQIERAATDKQCTVLDLKDGRHLVVAQSGFDFFLNDPQVEEIAYLHITYRNRYNDRYAVPVRYANGKWGMYEVYRDEKEGLEVYQVLGDNSPFTSARPQLLDTGDGEGDNKYLKFTVLSDGANNVSYFGSTLGQRRWMTKF